MNGRCWNPTRNKLYDGTLVLKRMIYWRVNEPPAMSTPYHAKFYAYELTRHYSGDTIKKISFSLFDACVDLNPHQIDAALFALRSPFSKGVLLADEVGLGKTIEAGLLLCQFWAERKRRLLVICPASLRKQWSLELQEKFHLPNLVIDADSYREAQVRGSSNPFDQTQVLITSIHFASRKSTQLRTIPWDLVVIDEAHKLRNVFHPSSKMAQEIRWAMEGRRKVLLTATPLQNSLNELYGLASLIDEHIFGDLQAFRSQFAGLREDYSELQHRLSLFCKRTLRNQVSEYVRYTERRAITLPFHPSDEEQALHDALALFLQQQVIYAVPKGQSHLLVLILHKLLASSTYAVIGTLVAIKVRLENLAKGYSVSDQFIDDLMQSEEIEADILEESEESDDKNGEAVDPVQLEEEIRQIDRLLQMAISIRQEAKAIKLLQALEAGFHELDKMAAKRKALIFTESRRTQTFIADFLQQNGYAGRIVLFNGTNNDEFSQAIYAKWLKRQQAAGQAGAGRAVDMRTALLEHFRDSADIMIATEAAAEGLNLQFCSLVINYDLPWNPQRIEQRIGRCHRYGQKFDVVVINFLNKRNLADQRVYELLTDKFNLFNGVFGASDEILGNIESGVDFERRILTIYQQCRTPQEINLAFQALQKEMEESIQQRLDATRRLLLEHFDQDVQSRLHLRLQDARQQLNRMGMYFWELSRFVLQGKAKFDDQAMSLDLQDPPLPNTPAGYYELISKERRRVEDAFLYRLSHPLGEYVLEAGRRAMTPVAEVRFDISRHPVKVSMIRSLKKKMGWLALYHLAIESIEPEDYLIFSAFDDQGKPLDQDQCEHLFYCRGTVKPLTELAEGMDQRLKQAAEKVITDLNQTSQDRGRQYFLEECEKLEKWSEDVVTAAESQMNEVKKQIKELTHQSRQLLSALEQHRLHRTIADLESRKRQLRKKIFEVEDEILLRRDDLIHVLEKRMARRVEVHRLFAIRWVVV